MFSGIVEESARVLSLHEHGGGYQLCVQSNLDHSTTGLGDSIAVNGVCLTVVQNENGALSFDLAEETLRRTALGDLTKSMSVNLERSLELGERVHGHLMFGHVDGVGSVVSRHVEGSGVKLLISFDSKLRPYLATKGSIALSGVSLTLGEIEQNTFAVYLVPHTLEVTTISDWDEGQRVNLEVDMLARYVHEQLEWQRETANSKGDSNV